MSNTSTRSHVGGISVVLAAHGDRGGEAPNSGLMDHCEALRALEPGARFVAGVLKGHPSIEDALHAAAGGTEGPVIVYPLFMSDGYFVRRVLAERIAASAYSSRCRVLPPLGLDPKVASLVDVEAAKEARRRGHAPDACRLVVVAHGSGGGTALARASAEATEVAAARLRAGSRFADVVTAYLEEPPSLAARLAEDTRPTVVAGLFSGEGLHGAEDVPAIVAEYPFATYAGPVGRSEGMPALILGSVKGLV